MDATENVAAKRPRTCSQSTKITALNDDCLMEIYEHLALEELWSMKNSDQRFINTADRFFKNKFLERSDYFCFCGNLGIYTDYDESERIVKLFGDVITKVRIDVEKNTHRIFGLLNHCSAMEELNFFFV